MSRGYNKLRNIVLGWLKGHPNIRGTGSYSLAFNSGIIRKNLYPNYKDRYYVSKHGRVFRYIKKLNLWYEVIYRVRIDARGNRTPHGEVRIKMNGSYISLSRLVALVWVNNPNPKKYNIVMHLDNDKMNNSYCNLQWGTQKMNIGQALREKRLPTLFVSGPSNPSYGKRQSNLSPEDERDIIRDIKSKRYTRIQLSKKWGVSRATLNNVLRRNNCYDKF